MSISSYSSLLLSALHTSCSSFLPYTTRAQRRRPPFADPPHPDPLASGLLVINATLPQPQERSGDSFLLVLMSCRSAVRHPAMESPKERPATVTSSLYSVLHLTWPRQLQKVFCSASSIKIHSWALHQLDSPARGDAITVMMQFVARACAVLGWPSRGPSSRRCCEVVNQMAQVLVCPQMSDPFLFYKHKCSLCVL